MPDSMAFIIAIIGYGITPSIVSINRVAPIFLCLLCLLLCLSMSTISPLELPDLTCTTLSKKTLKN